MKSDFPCIVVPPEVRPKMVEVPREFRKEPTPGERILWSALRGKKLDGIKFRRQQPVGYFVVDFYNSTYRLVVEVDGPSHEHQAQADKSRQEVLEASGLSVLRIKTEIIEYNLPMALEAIRNSIQVKKQNIHTPSPYMGEGQGGGS